MPRALDIGVTTVEDATFLKLTGVIDEDNTLASTLKKIDGRTVVLDLSGVERINSCGVRDWVNWINDLEGRGHQVVLVRCSPSIVTQINMVHNFTGGARVRSFFAPYYCARCDREELKLLNVEDFAGQEEPAAPPHRGRGCELAACEMVFDDIEASWFAFLPRNNGGVVDEQLETLINSVSPGIRERIRRLDEVRGSDGGRASLSSQYSPLTVTRTQGSGVVEATPEPVEPEPPKSRSTIPLLILAAGLVGAIVTYVITQVVG